MLKLIWFLVYVDKLVKEKQQDTNKLYAWKRKIQVICMLVSSTGNSTKIRKLLKLAT